MAEHDLMALAEKCEAVTGPDRALFCKVIEALAPTGAISYEQQALFLRYVEAGAWLDAAMSLVPERWKLRQMNFSAPCADDRKWHLNLHGGREGEDTFVGRGSTPALAITAAALRAHAGGLNA